MTNPLDEFERFSYNAGEDDLKSDFQLIDDPIWSFREKKPADNADVEELRKEEDRKAAALDNLDKSPLERSNDVQQQQQQHLSNLFSQNWNTLQTVSPQQVSLDWTPTQSTADFPKTSKSTSSPATAALANFNEPKTESYESLFQPRRISEQRRRCDYLDVIANSHTQTADLRAFNSSSSSSDEETNFPSVQPTQPLPQHQQPPATMKPPSPPGNNKDIANTHKRTHAETHSHPHTQSQAHPQTSTSSHSRSQSNTQAQKQTQKGNKKKDDNFSPASSPGYQSSEDEYDDSYGAQPIRQRRRQTTSGSTNKPIRNPKLTLEQIDTKHIPYPFELTDDGLVKCVYTSPVAPYKRCKTSFQRPYDLARHMETIHSRDEAQLVKSGKITPAQITIPGLAKDLEEAEKDPKKAEKLVAVQVYKCDGDEGCGYVFSRKDALIRHRRIRGHGVPKQS
ncbi:hypothetical protein E3P99_00306 [Wallemia hederae]|uniref:C2H2-type domain-containing protein n=1 Tax=Wallemia hederae TaxID=1540922 RepID=A0A4T0FZ83_9BASI|nr:hypothetical protein E3P99_00306 [Wallemia hederae]